MKPTTRSATADNVRAEVARRRVRQADLADLLGISQQAMSRRLHGEVSLTVDELKLIAAHLDMPVHVLLGEPQAAAS